MEKEDFMSKKIYFATVNKEVVATVNNVLEVCFVHASVSTELSKEKSALRKELAEVVEKIANGTAKDGEKLAVEKKINIVTNKQKALVAWRKNTLYTHKAENSEEWVEGLYAKLGINQDLLEVRDTCATANTWGKWNDAIRKLLAEVFGLNFADDKLPAKFASYLEHLVGATLGSNKDILKGKLLKDDTRFNNFAELMARGMATYMAKTCEDIVLPTAEFYTASVKFDKDLRVVEEYTMTAATAEEVAEEVAEAK